MTPDDQLQYTDLLAPEFQQTALALMCQHPVVVARARAVVEPTYFVADVDQAICKALFAFWDQYGTLPKPETLRIAVSKYAPDDTTAAAYRHQVDECLGIEPTTLDIAFIEEQLVWFSQRAQAAAAVRRAFEDVRAFDIEALEAKLRTIVQLPGNLLDRGLDFRTDWARVLETDTRLQYSTGIEALDNNMRGGLREGELLSVLARMKGGKTMFLYNLGLAFMRNGFNVVVYSLEVYQDDGLMRLVSACTGRPTNSLAEYGEYIASYMEGLGEYTNGQLVIKEFPGGSTPLAMLDAHVTSLEASSGKPWVIIVDYADLLRKSTGEEWSSLENTYMELRNLGRRHRVPVITATQSNASGFKAPQLGAQHLAGSTRKAFIVDYMWSVDASDDDYEAGRFTLTSILARHGKKNERTYWRAFYDTGQIVQVTQDVWNQLTIPQQGVN